MKLLELIILESAVGQKWLQQTFPTHVNLQFSFLYLHLGFPITSIGQSSEGCLTNYFYPGKEKLPFAAHKFFLFYFQVLTLPCKNHVEPSASRCVNRYYIEHTGRSFNTDVPLLANMQDSLYGQNIFLQQAVNIFISVVKFDILRLWELTRFWSLLEPV